jgi:hypothetical protein
MESLLDALKNVMQSIVRTLHDNPNLQDRELHELWNMMNQVKIVQDNCQPFLNDPDLHEEIQLIIGGCERIYAGLARQMMLNNSQVCIIILFTFNTH